MRLFIALLCWMLATPAFATESTVHFKGTWFVSWNAIPFAKLWIDTSAKDSRFELTAAFKSRGLLRIFSHMKTLTTGHGTYIDSNAQTLILRYDNKDADKHNYMEFAEDGSLLSRDLKPKDDPNYRPDVPSSKLRGVTTTVDLLWDLRGHMQQILASGEQQFEQPFFDGKRLMSIRANYKGVATQEIDGQPTDVHVLELSRSLIDGFTEKEKRRFAKGEPPAILYIDQQTLFPIGLEVYVKFGTMRGYWKAEK